MRVAERPREQRPGYTGLPRWENHGELTVDWVPDDRARTDRPACRTAQGRRAGAAHVHVAPAGRSVRRRAIGRGGDRDVKFVPGSELEEYGVEDPRITPLDGRFYFTYVAVSRHGAATALALDGRLPGVHPPRRHLLLREQGRGPLPRAGRRGARGPAPAQRGDAVHAGPRCGWPGPRTSSTGAITAPCTVGGAEWETGRVGAGTPPVRVARRLAGDLPRQPPPDRARRGRRVLDGRTPPGPGEPLPDPPPDPGIDLRADRRLRAPRLRPRRRLPDRDRRDRETFLVYYGAADTCTAVVEFSKEELMSRLVLV